VTEGNPSTLLELNMETFLRSVADIVERFGLETFFYLPDSDNVMRYLPEEPHKLTLASVLAEHQSRVTEPAAVWDDKGDETPASVAAQFKCYNPYELCDFSLSRLAIETLVHPDLRAEVVVQYNHIPSFKKLPGNVYLMMVLDACHELFEFKMDDAAKSLSELTLASFEGENVSKFANEAQRLIKIMKGGHSLPYQIDSQVIQKVCATQSHYFNRSMFNLLDQTLAMEKVHGPHRDPKMLECDPGYVKYGPLGVRLTLK